MDQCSVIEQNVPNLQKLTHCSAPALELISINEFNGVRDKEKEERNNRLLSVIGSTE